MSWIPSFLPVSVNFDYFWCWSYYYFGLVITLLLCYFIIFYIIILFYIILLCYIFYYIIIFLYYFMLLLYYILHYFILYILLLYYYLVGLSFLVVFLVLVLEEFQFLTKCPLICRVFVKKFSILNCSFSFWLVAYIVNLSRSLYGFNWIINVFVHL